MNFKILTKYIYILYMKFLRIISYDIIQKKGKLVNINFRDFIFELKENFDSSKFIKELTYINFFELLKKESLKIYAVHLKKENNISLEEFLKFFEEEEASKKQYHFLYRNYSYFYLSEFVDAQSFLNKAKYILRRKYIPLEEFMEEENPNTENAESLISGYVLPIDFKIKKSEEKEIYKTIKKNYSLRLNQYRVGFHRTRKLEMIRSQLNEIESSLFWITKYKGGLFSPALPSTSVSFSIPTDDPKNYFSLTFNGLVFINSFAIISEMFYSLVQPLKKDALA